MKLSLSLYITGVADFDELFAGLDRAKFEAKKMWEASGETLEDLADFEAFDFDIQAGGTKIDLSINAVDDDE